MVLRTPRGRVVEAWRCRYDAVLPDSSRPPLVQAAASPFTQPSRPSGTDGASRPRQGPLGAIKEGTCTDILLGDVNPVDDVALPGDDGKNLPLVMNDGKIHQNALR